MLQWRPLRPTFSIWTPRLFTVGVQITLLTQSGCRPDSPVASSSATTKNMDAMLTLQRRPSHSPSQIWTPRRRPTGVHSALQPQAGRHANNRKASNLRSIPNLDAAFVYKWRPICSPSLIWTPRQPPTGVHSALQPQSGRHPSP